ncbi:hypothetical protein AX774_g158 [Zancudomyces culisetae]|uniref:Uncharacterized protein n=1 Tax=Zancudomyces culisetae TaxID=1213189 RepID=A0A1R1PZB3_ZANCU|nr:hypothetical protein AX774_g158 [Zancudomyces culisetae]|eukprot:OMH86267.1 hypothetical protein AX774_g158 [Zancudomyces culisetae]
MKDIELAENRYQEQLKRKEQEKSQSKDSGGRQRGKDNRIDIIESDDNHHGYYQHTGGKRSKARDDGSGGIVAGRMNYNTDLVLSSEDIVEVSKRNIGGYYEFDDIEDISEITIDDDDTVAVHRDKPRLRARNNENTRPIGVDGFKNGGGTLIEKAEVSSIKSSPVLGYGGGYVNHGQATKNHDQKDAEHVICEAISDGEYDFDASYLDNFEAQYSENDNNAEDISYDTGATIGAASRTVERFDMEYENTGSTDMFNGQTEKKSYALTGVTNVVSNDQIATTIINGESSYFNGNSMNPLSTNTVTIPSTTKATNNVSRWILKCSIYRR